jgi:Resolvase, N terminal domain
VVGTDPHPRPRPRGAPCPTDRTPGLLTFAREGDEVLVHSMDPPARNVEDLRRLVRALTGKGAQVVSVTEG